jgi:excisionase family DNA binding protein
MPLHLFGSLRGTRGSVLAALKRINRVKGRKRRKPRDGHDAGHICRERPEGGFPKERMTERDDGKDSSENPGGARFLSRREVSRLFGVSASTVTRWARLGVLKAARTPGGHYRFPADETRRAADRAFAGELSRLD